MVWRREEPKVRNIKSFHHILSSGIKSTSFEMYGFIAGVPLFKIIGVLALAILESGNLITKISKYMDSRRNKSSKGPLNRNLFSSS